MKSEHLAWLIRRHGIEMTHISHGSHIGAILSVADIVAVLYNDVANISPENLKDENRDRIILSKGHAGAAIYAALAEKGFFDREELKTHYADGSRLSGHVSHKGVPGVEFSSGSLGHGLPVACGMAMAAVQAGRKHRVFCMVSDGDLNEGSTWEAVMLAGQHHWDNLIMLVDYNRLQALGKSDDIIDLTSLKQKLELFGWAVRESDGHDQNAIYDSLSELPVCSGKPSAVIFYTTKGKGVSFMENDYKWHYGGLTDELLEKALKEVEAAR